MHSSALKVPGYWGFLFLPQHLSHITGIIEDKESTQMLDSKYIYLWHMQETIFHYTRLCLQTLEE